MMRKIFIGAAATILVILGMNMAFAHPVTPNPDSNPIFQRSPDCKYPPCD